MPGSLAPVTAFPATKAELRAAALARRAELGANDRAEASRRAAGRLHPFVSRGGIVALFWPMRDEIDPRGLIDAVLEAGGSVAMPVVEKRRMFFRRFDGEACLEPGVFGTSHPHAGQPWSTRTSSWRRSPRSTGAADASATAPGTTIAPSQT